MADYYVTYQANKEKEVRKFIKKFDDDILEVQQGRKVSKKKLRSMS